MSRITFGILIVSDSRSEGSQTNTTGPELKGLVSDDGTEIGAILKGTVVKYEVVEDDEKKIMDYLKRWSNVDKVNVILTSGGTGLSLRDVTPEATKKVITREVNGIATAMLLSSLKVTPMAMLSRAVCGTCAKTLIVNLPGSLKAVKECLKSIAGVIPHAVDLILNNDKRITETHDSMQQDDVSHTCSHNSRALKNVVERDRNSTYAMISVAAAEEKISAQISKTSEEFEIVTLSNSCGRVLFDREFSLVDVPSFRASIKDGYAVLASDESGKRQVLGGVQAGSEPASVALKPGTCVRVNTGAPIPNEATAVVQVEDTKLISYIGSEEKEIEINTQPEYGQDIRPIGCDIREGSLALESRTKLGAAEVGLLASCGHKEAKVFRLPSVGVLSTGDELQEPGSSLTPGHIYDSNRLTLISLIKEYGFYPVDFGMVKDDEDSLVTAIECALKRVDVLVTSGSVSMGDSDMLKPVLQRYFLVKIHFGRVNMKPGKPTTFATGFYGHRKKYFLCLPGNPVSATVTCHLFVLPLLNQLNGDSSKPAIVKAQLTSSYYLDSRPEYVRAILRWDRSDLPKAYTTGDQISSKLLSCKNANALLMLPGRTDWRKELHSGDKVDAMLLGFKQCT